MQEEDRNQLISDKEETVNKITDEIFNDLIKEMKVDLDLLLVRDPRRMYNEEGKY